MESFIKILQGLGMGAWFLFLSGIYIGLLLLAVWAAVEFIGLGWLVVGWWGLIILAYLGNLGFHGIKWLIGRLRKQV